MNKIKDEEVNKYLLEQFNYIKEHSGIAEDKIVGIFVVGKICHGFAKTMTDLELIACYIPTFEELCLNIYPYRYKEKCGNVRMTDFRYLYNLLIEQDISVMECIFTEYKIINDIYKITFDKYVYINRETIFKYSPSNRISNAVKRGLDSAHNYFLNFNKGDINELYEACRIRIACELLLSGTSIENCINLKKDYHINYLQDILDEKIKPTLDELENDFYDLEDRAKNIVSNEETLKLIQELLFSLYTVGLTKKRDFKKLLTANEQQAFDIIKTYLNNGKGYISISQLVDENKMSRPVFKNVLQKMKDSKVAEITSKGVKGTFIEIKDFSIL